jgi:hypothetical protein
MDNIGFHAPIIRPRAAVLDKARLGFANHEY